MLAIAGQCSQALDRARLFEAEREAAGAVLDLYIASQIVEPHGGTLSVASDPGNGAAFTIRLPRGLHR